LLVDFRDQSNPKRRELTRRVLDDITRSVLSLSPFGDIQYFLGRTAYNFITGRRGMDINQPSRLRSYALLKLLLSLNASIDPTLAAETSRLIEKVSMNPLQNDLDVEAALAERSRAALLASASDPNGTVVKLLTRGRQTEYSRLEHSTASFTLLRVAMIATAGIYRHRESAPADVQLASLDTSRRVAYHRRFVEEVLDSTPVVEVGWDVADVRRSVEFLAAHTRPADRRNIRLIARVFDRTHDPEMRRACVDGLAHIGGPAAQHALAQMFASPDADADLRALALASLGAPPASPRRVTPGPAVLASASTR
jgi:hypothetical protein